MPVSRSWQLIRRGAILALPVFLLLAACSNGAGGQANHSTSTPVADGTTKATAVAGTPAPTYPPVTPIPGNYSVYVDPTWGYSFEYPSAWQVYPAHGHTYPDNSEESNVAITEPYVVTVVHPMTLLIVRATNDFRAEFAHRWICNIGKASTTTVAGFPAYVIDNYGGDPVAGYTGVYYGRSFKAKGLAFQILLQGSPKVDNYNNVIAFQKLEKPVFDHIIATFDVGPGTQTVADC